METRSLLYTFKDLAAALGPIDQRQLLANYDEECARSYGAYIPIGATIVDCSKLKGATKTRSEESVQPVALISSPPPAHLLTRHQPKGRVKFETKAKSERNVALYAQLLPGSILTGPFSERFEGWPELEKGIAKTRAAVHRSIEARRARDAKRSQKPNAKPDARRPMNCFFVYRSIVSELASKFFENDSQNDISVLCSHSWKQEPENGKLKQLAKSLAVLETTIHKEAFPTYKYQPKKGGKQGGLRSKDRHARRFSTDLDWSDFVPGLSRASSMVPDSSPWASPQQAFALPVQPCGPFIEPESFVDGFVPSNVYQEYRSHPTQSFPRMDQFLPVPQQHYFKSSLSFPQPVQLPIVPQFPSNAQMFNRNACSAMTSLPLYNSSPSMTNLPDFCPDLSDLSLFDTHVQEPFKIEDYINFDPNTLNEPLVMDF